MYYRLESEKERQRQLARKRLELHKQGKSVLDDVSSFQFVELYILILRNLFKERDHVRFDYDRIEKLWCHLQDYRISIIYFLLTDKI